MPRRLGEVQERFTPQPQHRLIRWTVMFAIEPVADLEGLRVVFDPMNPERRLSPDDGELGAATAGQQGPGG
jgi:hypothetical protein